MTGRRALLMEGSDSDVVLDELRQRFPDRRVFNAWCCLECEVFSTEENQVVNEDGDCANCGEHQAVRVIVVK